MRLPILVLVYLLFSVLAVCGANAQEDDENEGAVSTQSSQAAPTDSSTLASIALSDPITGRIEPFFKQGFASEDELRFALGNLTYFVTACKNNPLTPADITVSVRSEKSAYDNGRVIDAVLLRAAQFAWNQCQLHFIFGFGHEMAELRHNITSVDLYLADGTHAVSASYLNGDDTFHVGHSYRWGSVTDVGAAARQAAAQAEAQRQRFANQERYIAQRIAASDLWWSNVWNTIKSIFWLTTFGAIVLWMFNRREPILRWYYFTFHPHPAAPMVEAALASETVLNGKVIAAALGEMPASRIFREVRLAQGERLVQQMQEMSRWHARQMEAKVREEYERAAVQSLQEAIALAAAALARAKAFHNASKTVGAGYA